MLLATTGSPPSLKFLMQFSEKQTVCKTVFKNGFCYFGFLKFFIFVFFVWSAGDSPSMRQWKTGWRWRVRLWNDCRMSEFQSMLRPVHLPTDQGGAVRLWGMLWKMPGKYYLYCNPIHSTHFCPYLSVFINRYLYHKCEIRLITLVAYGNHFTCWKCNRSNF